MADVDIDPLGEHESRTDKPTDEHIPLDPVTPGKSTWEPDRREIVKWGFWRKLPLLPLLCHTSAVDEN